LENGRSRVEVAILDLRRSACDEYSTARPALRRANAQEKNWLYAQGNLPRADEISVNARALAFTVALSSLVAVALGLVSLLRFSKRDLQESLKESSRGGNRPTLRTIVCGRCSW